MNKNLEIIEKIKLKITNEYLGKELSCSSFIELTNDCLQEAGKIELSDDYYRSRHIKLIREEALPISIFLQNQNLGISSVTPSEVEHSNYDAKIFGSFGSMSLEVTFLKDGQKELFTAHHLERFGYAPLSGVTKEDLKSAVNNESPCHGEATDILDRISYLADGVIQLIEVKNSNPKYTRPIILIVAIEDDFREHVFLSVLDNCKKMQQSTFEQIYLVSTNTKLCGQIC